MRTRIVKPEDITPDTQNANKGTERGNYMIAKSLAKYGAGRSIVGDKHGNIISGEHVFMNAADLGLEMVEVETDGSQLVVVKRTDLELGDEGRARELSVVDNRVTQVSIDLDPNRLLETIQNNDMSDFFREEEVLRLENQIARSMKLGEALEGETPTPPESGIKMVQIFFDTKQHESFMAMVDDLKGALGVETITEVVAKCVEQTHGSYTSD